MAKKRALSARALAALGDWWIAVQSGRSNNPPPTVNQNDDRFASVS
jgi:hypothetical protein